MSKLSLALTGAVSVQALCSAFAAQIDSTVTTPVSTSTANSGSPGDLTVTTDGAIEIDGADGVAAITLDSNNAVSVAGEVTLTETDNAQGILIKDGFSGSVKVSGDIFLDDGYEREDTDDDDDLDGPFAVGSNRTGILLESGGTFTGNVNIQTGGSVVVEGNDSAGVMLNSVLAGSLVVDGEVSVVGDNAVGVGVNETVTGDVLFSSNISAQGENAAGVLVTGDVGGTFINEGVIQSTGFASTSASNYVAPTNVTDDTPPLDERIDAEDLNDNRAALGVGASLAHGFLNNGAIGGRDEDDEVKDAIEDYDENRTSGVIRSYGSAPAVLISPDLDPSGTGDLTLGKTVEKVRDTTDDDDDDNTTEVIATFNYDYGAVLRGTISGIGLNSGYDATALRIEGSADGLRSTIVDGGVYAGGSISASAREGDATAVSIGSGAIVSRIRNTGTISAGTLTENGKSAVAIDIENDGYVSSLENTGSISATTYGYTGTSTAIRDRSGTLTAITNQGSITATLSAIDGEAQGTARAVAIDLSTHDASSPVTILQTFRTPTKDTNGDGEIDTDDVSAPSLTGAVLLGAGDDVVDVRAGFIQGSISTGSGADTVLISGATVEADIAFGAGADVLSLSDGATFRGALSDSDHSLDIDVVDSYFAVANESSVVIDTLNVTGDSAIEINIDLKSDDLSEPRLIAQTSAFIDSNTSLYAAVENFNNDEYSVVLLRSPDLVFNGDASLGIGVETPAIFYSDVETSATDLSLVIRPKTASELGLNTGEAGAYEAILALASQNDAVGDALTSYFDADELIDDYRSLMPVRHEAATRIISGENSLATGPLAQRMDLLSGHNASDGLGYWAQISAGYATQSSTAEISGYKGALISFHGGVDRSLTPGLLVGLSGAFMTADARNKETHEKQAETTAFQFGPYAAWRVGPLTLSAAGAYGLSQINTERTIRFGDATDNIKGERKGHYIAGSARAAFEANAGRFYFRPSASLDYLTLDHKAYTETSDVSESPYVYAIESTTTDRLSASGVFNLGRRKGDYNGNTENTVSAYGSMGGYTSRRVSFQNIYAGYRTELDATPYEALATIVETGDSFTIIDASDYGDALLFGASMGFSDEGMSLSLSYDGEMSDETMIHRAGLNFRMKF